MMIRANPDDLTSNIIPASVFMAASHQSPACPPVLHIDLEGRWFADGRAITHPGTHRLFSRSLVKVDGKYRVRIGHNEYPLTVEDTPRVVRSLRAVRNAAGGEDVFLLLNDGRRLALDPANLEFAKDGVPYCRFDPGRRLRARFARAAWQQLLALLDVDEHGECCYLVLDNRRVTFAPRTSADDRP
jgi:hypothetical protein